MWSSWLLCSTSSWLHLLGHRCPSGRPSVSQRWSLLWTRWKIPPDCVPFEAAFFPTLWPCGSRRASGTAAVVGLWELWAGAPIAAVHRLHAKVLSACRGFELRWLMLLHICFLWLLGYDLISARGGQIPTLPTWYRYLGNIRCPLHSGASGHPPTANQGLGLFQNTVVQSHPADRV